MSFSNRWFFSGHPVHLDASCWLACRGSILHQRKKTENAGSSHDNFEGIQYRLIIVFKCPAEIVDTTERWATENPVHNEGKLNVNVYNSRGLNPAGPSPHVTVRGVSPLVRTKNRKEKTKPGKFVAEHFQYHVMKYALVRALANHPSGLSISQLCSGHAKNA